MVIKALAGLIVGALLIGAIALLIAWPVQLLWNDLMPDLFGIKRITFLQALELSALASLLFKSSGSSSKD